MTREVNKKNIAKRNINVFTYITYILTVERNNAIMTKKQKRLLNTIKANKWGVGQYHLSM